MTDPTAGAAARRSTSDGTAVQAGAGRAMAGAHPVVFYDGVCGLCDRFVRFILHRDTGGLFRFAALQSQFAREILPAARRDLDTVCVFTGEEILMRSDAVLYVLDRLNSPAVRALRAVPRPLRELAYRAVARVRYPVFGRFDACRLPDPAWGDRFVQ